MPALVVAKAFKVKDFRALMGNQKANEARLKSAVEFGKTEMSEGSELHQSTLRATLYALMELSANLDGSEVLAHRVRQLEYRFPQHRADLVSLLHREAKVITTEYENDDILVTAFVPAAIAGRLEAFATAPA